MAYLKRPRFLPAPSEGEGAGRSRDMDLTFFIYVRKTKSANSPMFSRQWRNRRVFAVSGFQKGE